MSAQQLQKASRGCRVQDGSRPLRAYGRLCGTRTGRRASGVGLGLCTAVHRTCGTRPREIMYDVRPIGARQNRTRTLSECGFVPSYKYFVLSTTTDLKPSGYLHAHVSFEMQRADAAQIVHQDGILYLRANSVVHGTDAYAIGPGLSNSIFHLRNHVPHSKAAGTVPPRAREGRCIGPRGTGAWATRSSMCPASTAPSPTSLGGGRRPPAVHAAHGRGC